MGGPGSARGSRGRGGFLGTVPSFGTSSWALVEVKKHGRLSGSFESEIVGFLGSFKLGIVRVGENDRLGK